MKLNSDCIRAVMLKVEEMQTYTCNDEGYIESNYLGIEALYDALPDFTHEDIFYALFNLEQAGYVNLSMQWDAVGTLHICIINYMTYDGHEFLEKISDSMRWKIVKSGLTAIRDYSLDAINAVANGVAGAAISAYIDKLEL